MADTDSKQEIKEMITVKCQHSGIEFEAKSKRTQQHPLVASFKNESAGRSGNYSNALRALDKAADYDYETIEEYMTIVNEIYSGKEQARKEREADRRQAEYEANKERAEQKARRRAQNDHLRNHGYNWKKEEIIDFDQYEEYDPRYARFVWILYAPDGREVAVEQALDEIERGTDVVLAEIEAQEQAEREAEAESQAAEETEQANLEAAKAEVETIEVEPFDYDDFKIIYESPRQVGSNSYTRVFSSKINGVPAGVTYRYSDLGNDYDEFTRFWCADPEVAGLARVERDDMEKTWAAFFGG